MTTSEQRQIDWCEVINLKLRIADDDGVDIFADPKDIPEEYVVAVEARLCIDDVTVGRFRGCLIRGDNVVNDEQSTVEVLDELSAELGEIAGHLFDSEDSYVEEVMDKHEPYGRKILYLQYLSIEAPFRGHDFGLAILQHVLRFCPHDIAIMKPHPLQHRVRDERPGEPVADEYPEFRDVTLEAGKAKLSDHYARLGFTPLGETEYMLRGDTHQHDWLPIDVPEKTLRRLRGEAKKLKLRLKGTPKEAPDQ